MLFIDMVDGKFRDGAWDSGGGRGSSEGDGYDDGTSGNDDDDDGSG